MSEIEINSSLKKRFVSDFKLPINVFSEPYFSYYTELYEPVYNIEEKMQWFKKVLSKFNTVDEFFVYSESVSQNIKKAIAETNAYKELNSVDMNKDFPLEEQVKQQNIYIDPNVGKKLISIDLQKANFNSLNVFGLKNELNINSYEDLMKLFTDDKYFLESKKIRQVIFGDLNPSRQQRIQKYIINTFCKKLKEAGCILTSASSDEIIIQNPDMNIERVKSILRDVPEQYKFFRVEEFHFERIDQDHDFFIKKTKQENAPDKLEFKNVPGPFFAQVYKKYLGLDIIDKDMVFYHEGYLAEFKQSIFDPEVAKKKTHKFK